MKKVHTEIYMNRTIEIYEDTGYEYDWTLNCDVRRTFFHASIDGEMILTSYGYGLENTRYYKQHFALSGAKTKIRKNASKSDERKEIEKQIAELQAKLEKLRG